MGIRRLLRVTGSDADRSLKDPETNVLTGMIMEGQEGGFREVEQAEGEVAGFDERDVCDSSGS